MEDTLTDVQVVPTSPMEETAIDFENSGKLVSVGSQDDYEFQVQVIRDIDKEWKRVEAFRVDLKKPFDDALVNLQSKFTPILKRLKNATDTRRDALNTYDNEQARLQREKEKKIEEENKKKQQDLEDEAKKATDEGKTAKAATLQLQADVTPTAMTKVAPAKVKGVARKTKYSFEVIDIDKVPRMWLRLNEKAIQTFINSTKGGTKIEGINISSSSGVAIR